MLNQTLDESVTIHSWGVIQVPLHYIQLYNNEMMIIHFRIALINFSVKKYVGVVKSENFE